MRHYQLSSWRLELASYITEIEVKYRLKLRWYELLRIHISGVTKCVTKCVTKFLTLSKSPYCDSVKKFVTHFVTPEIWSLTNATCTCGGGGGIEAASC